MNKDDDIESNYGEEDDETEGDTDYIESETKVDDDDDEDEDNDAPKKRMHVYHQIPESTQIRITAPGQRVTSEFMTLAEYATVVGTRATHIANGSTLFTDPEGFSDPRDIAKKEIDENRCPLCISRKVSPTTVEVWEVNEMIKP